MSAFIDVPADSPQFFLAKAKRDLAMAERIMCMEELCSEYSTYLAQQSAEKALKAVLISRRRMYPRTHSIQLLIDLALDAGLVVPDDVRESAKLTGYAVATRYDDEFQQPDRDEEREAVRLAAEVVSWAESVIGSSGDAG